MNKQYTSNHLLFVIYDGIENSVFQSQVLQPLINLLNKENNYLVTLASFEPTSLNQQKLEKLMTAHPRLTVKTFKRFPFIGKLNLLLAAQHLKKIDFTNYTAITARGPLAGFVMTHALKNEPIPITVQARGLCAEEYRYAHKKEHSSWVKKMWRKFIFKQLEGIERSVFSNSYKNMLIEAVSPALKEYLITHFGANEKKIYIALKDIPPTIDAFTHREWRAYMRKKLNIGEETLVYCYNGSYKPWQCAQESIELFEREYKKNQHSFLLILSQDAKIFNEKLEKSSIPKNKYVVMNVALAELYKFLAAADIGLLLREKDIINWVSRPTKMLDYEAVGLRILHNNTVAWLTHHVKNESDSTTPRTDQMTSAAHATQAIQEQYHARCNE